MVYTFFLTCYCTWSTTSPCSSLVGFRYACRIVIFGCSCKGDCFREREREKKGRLLRDCCETIARNFGERERERESVCVCIVERADESLTAIDIFCSVSKELFRCEREIVSREMNSFRGICFAKGESGSCSFN